MAKVKTRHLRGGIGRWEEGAFGGPKILKNPKLLRSENKRTTAKGAK